MAFPQKNRTFLSNFHPVLALAYYKLNIKALYLQIGELVRRLILHALELHHLLVCLGLMLVLGGLRAFCIAFLLVFRRFPLIEVNLLDLHLLFFLFLPFFLYILYIWLIYMCMYVFFDITIEVLINSFAAP
jgi:hypothetical protein